MAPKSMKSTKRKNMPSDPDVASFPLRVAYVDMGSNAIRFLSAEFSNRKISLLFLGEEQPIEEQEPR